MREHRRCAALAKQRPLFGKGRSSVLVSMAASNRVIPAVCRASGSS
jgi:hypothetical protein